MVVKHDIQYITEFYTPGSEAPQVAPKQPRKPKRAPKYVVQEPVKIYVDPVALGSVITAIALVVLMVVCVWQFMGVLESHEIMADHLLTLRDENAILEHNYRSGYDLDQIEEQALALGMIPVSQAQHIQVYTVAPQVQAEPTVWENIVWFFEGLFE